MCATAPVSTPPPSAADTPSIAPSSKYSMRSAVCALAVFFVTLLCAMRGIAWHPGPHPDELKIGHWMRQVQENGYITDRFYPTGFFQLAVPLVYSPTLKKINSISDGWQLQSGECSTHRVINSATPIQGSPFSSEGMRLILFGRRFNSLLLAATALLAFLASKRIFGSNTLALLTGLLMGLNPFALEHVHYCETDICGLFMLALTLYTMIAAISRYSLLLSAIAAFLAGFATTCKPITLPLVVMAPIVAVYCAVKSRRKSYIVVMSVIFALALSFCGFLAGTPALFYQSLPDFAASIQRASTRTYGEISGILGQARNMPNIKIAFKLHCLATEACKLPLVWWMSFLLAIPFLFIKRLRKHLLGFPLLILLLVLQSAFLVPWLRNQEMLPFIFPCLLAFGAPTAYFSGLKARKTRALLTALAYTLVVAALIASSIDAARTLSFFTQRDPRYVLSDWLYESYPDNHTLYMDSYSTFVRHSLPFEFSNASNAEFNLDWFGSKASETPPNGYYFAIPNMDGRGHRHPITGELYPAYAKSLASFTNSCERIIAYGISGRKKTRAIFSGCDAQLWRLCAPSSQSTNKSSTIAIAPTRPIRLAFGGEPFFMASDSTPAGAEDAIRTTGKRTRVKFSAEPEETIFAVSRIIGPEGLKGKVEWSGIFSPRRADVSVGSPALFISKPGSFRSSELSIYPEAKVRMKFDETQGLGITTITKSPAEAARLLREAGAPDVAATFLATYCKQGASDQLLVECFRDAVESEHFWKITAEMTDAVKRTIDAYKEFCINSESDAEGWKETKFGGLSLQAHEDFARLNLHDLLLWEMESSPIPDVHTFDAQVPFSLPQGSYSLTITLNNSAAYDIGTGEDIAVALTGVQVQNVQLSGQNKISITIDFIVKSHVWPRLRLCSKKQLPPFVYVDAQLQWHPIEFLSSEVATLIEAWLKYEKFQLGD